MSLWLLRVVSNVSRMSHLLTVTLHLISDLKGHHVLLHLRELGAMLHDVAFELSFSTVLISPNRGVLTSYGFHGQTSPGHEWSLACLLSPSCSDSGYRVSVRSCRYSRMLLSLSVFDRWPRSWPRASSVRKPVWKRGGQQWCLTGLSLLLSGMSSWHSIGSFGHWSMIGRSLFDWFTHDGHRGVAWSHHS